MDKATAFLEEAEQWIEGDISCSCDPAYKDRNLRDPSCFYCDNKFLCDHGIKLIALARHAVELAGHLHGGVDHPPICAMFEPEGYVDPDGPCPPCEAIKAYQATVESLPEVMR